MTNVTVLGSGRWASFMAWYACKQGKNTTLWGRKGSKRLEELQKTRKNEYLELPKDVHLTDDLVSAVKNADYIIISISTQELRNFLRQLNSLQIVKPEQTFILCMKGMEIKTGKRLSEIFHEEMDTDNVAIWVGPGHVQSFYDNVPNCMVIDADDDERKARIIRELGSDLVRFYYGTDLIGNEIGAASKNVVGIAAGMLDGYGLTALKGALMARAPHEIARLIVALGGKPMTAYGLAHLGDYEATLFSLHSHNRQYGENFAKGLPSAKLAEGVPTLQAIHHIGLAHELDLPICTCLYRVIFEGYDALSELNGLFSRPLKAEFN